MLEKINEEVSVVMSYSAKQRVALLAALQTVFAGQPLYPEFACSAPWRADSLTTEEE